MNIEEIKKLRESREKGYLDEKSAYFDLNLEKVTPADLENFHLLVSPHMRELMAKYGKTKEIYGKIDRVMEETGADTGHITELMHKYDEMPTGSGNRQEFLDDIILPLLLPIYIELRKRGYTHKQLVTGS